MNNENIRAITLGEDGEYWLVTGTTDAHSAEQAVREQDRVESCSGAGYLDPHVPLGIEYRRDLCWRYGGLEPSRTEDDELLTIAQLFERYAHEARRVFPFSGYLVTV